MAPWLLVLPAGLIDGWERAGRSRAYVFGIWGAIASAPELAALAGYVMLDGASSVALAAVSALAAGAILAMITDTMIPEAFAKDSLHTGLLATLGLLAALTLHSLGRDRPDSPWTGAPSCRQFSGRHPWPDPGCREASAARPSPSRP